MGKAGTELALEMLLIQGSVVFCCYNRIPKVECFIKKRGLFSSQFWRLVVPSLWPLARAPLALLQQGI
jgi:hypothetical protein